MTRLKFRLLVWLEPGSARSAEAHNNCVNRILKDLQSPEISTIGLKVLMADGEKTMQSLLLMDPLAQLGTWEQFAEATWLARCFLLHLDETKMEAEPGNQGCQPLPLYNGPTQTV